MFHLTIICHPFSLLGAWIIRLLCFFFPLRRIFWIRHSRQHISQLRPPPPQGLMYLYRRRGCGERHLGPCIWGYWWSCQTNVMGCDASHIWSSFRNYNSSGRMNGQSMGGLIMFVSLSGRVALNKAFFQLPCQRRHLCSTEVLISWQRDEYDITGGGGGSLFSQYLSWWLPRMTVIILALWSLVSYFY